MTTTTDLPRSASLKVFVQHPAYNDGPLPVSAASALAAAYRLLDQQASTSSSSSSSAKTAASTSLFVPSRLYLDYHGARSKGPSPIGAALQWMHKEGIAPERCWPFVRYYYQKKPTAWCEQQAKRQRSGPYGELVLQKPNTEGVALSMVDAIREQLASAHVPVILTIKQHKSFPAGAKGAVIPIPGPVAEDPVLADYTVLVVGYTDEKKLFTFLNSMGPLWGNGGFGYLPYGFVREPHIVSAYWLTLGKASRF